MAELPGPSASLVDSPSSWKATYLKTRGRTDESRRISLDGGGGGRKGGKNRLRNAKPRTRVARVTMLDLSAEEGRINDFARSPEPFLGISRESVSGA